MARPPSFGRFVTDLYDAVEVWREQYVSEASLAQFQRACAWVVDESVKAVSVDMRGATQSTFQDPTPWMVQGWQYRRSLGKGRSIGLVEAEAYLLPEQSTVMKYAMGDRRNVRVPGDVGLAQDRILLPHWRNLRETQGIRPNASHDLPGATMARLVRNSQGVYAKRSVPGRWGVYKGEIKVGGSRLMGYIARPPRVRAPVTDYGQDRTHFVNRRGKVRDPYRVVNLGRPRILLIEARQAEYRPIMQDPWLAANASARKNVPDLMASELAKHIVHNGMKANRSRIDALIREGKEAFDRRDWARSNAISDEVIRLTKGGR